MCTRFPVSVPCRGTTFLNQITDVLPFCNLDVSVPCRGTTFLNKTLKLMIPEYYSFRPLSGNYISQYKQMALSTEILVSVPCRGTTFLNTNRWLSPRRSWFPSPVGELHFSIQTDGSLHGDPGFRPLSGNYISQFDRFMKEYEF